MRGYRPDIKHDHTPDYHAVSWAWLAPQRNVTLNRYVGNWCAWLIFWHATHVCLYIQTLTDVRSTGAGTDYVNSCNVPVPPRCQARERERERERGEGWVSHSDNHSAHGMESLSSEQAAKGNEADNTNWSLTVWFKAVLNQQEAWSLITFYRSIWE